MGMEYWTNLESYLKAKEWSIYIKKRKRKMYIDDPMSFDIETSSMFWNGNTWTSFDYTKSPDWYMDKPKAATCYIWMFGIDDKVYYGRNLPEFIEVLKLLKKYTGDADYIIYIHNASYEFQWLLDLMDGYTIKDMCCRSALKPIQWRVEELGVVFRCSYMLTNLSLADSAKRYTNLKKASGDLDYTPLRGSGTWLTSKEMFYCEMDIRTVQAIIRSFKKEYKHIERIPLTQTGEMRRMYSKEITYWDRVKIWRDIPDPEMYMIEMAGFWGGMTHSNIMNSLFVHMVGVNCTLLGHGDLTSSYPFHMLLEYPIEPFWYFSQDLYNIKDFRDTHLFIFHIRLHNIKSKYFNTYIPFSKCFLCTDGVIDNGRVRSASEVELIVTSIDYDIIMDAYKMESCEIVTAWAAAKGRLPRVLTDFILDLYEKKTTLKGVTKEDPTEHEYILNLYMKSKQIINSVFGSAVYNPLNSGTEYHQESNQWIQPSLEDDAFIKKKLDEMRKSYSIIIPYAAGIFITAWSRKTLWEAIIEHDDKILYYDTDSIFYKDLTFEEACGAANQRIIKQLEDFCRDTGTPWERLCPKDINGKEHLIGIFTKEDDMSEFISLGAKKYCLRNAETGKLEMTVAGCSKKAVRALHNDINEFKKDKTFKYTECGKFTHYYIDDQEPGTFIDLHGEVQNFSNRHSIVLQPTTYTLSYKELYERLHEVFEVGEIPLDI